MEAYAQSAGSGADSGLCRSFFGAVLSQGPDGLRKLFLDGAAVDWPCTNEHFSLEEYIRANCEYPGVWDGEIVSVLPAGDRTVMVTKVWPKDKSASYHCVSIIGAREGRIASLTEYWSDDGPAPAWRQALGIGTPMEQAYGAD